MLDSQSPQPRPGFLGRDRLLALVSLTLLFGNSPTVGGAIHLGAVQQGGGFVIFGRVRLPDGHPAKTRMKVFIEAMNGLRRDTLSDNDGNYEFRGMSGGRYRVYAINPD